MIYDTWDEFSSCSSWLIHSIYRSIIIVPKDNGQMVFSSAKYVEWVDAFASAGVNKGQTFEGSAIESLSNMD